MGWNAPSEEELENQGSDYDTLPEDEYIVEITGFEEKPNQANKFPSKNDPDPLHTMIIYKANVLTFANGDSLVDIKDEPLEGTVPIQIWLNPKKVGMIPRPSNTRKFFAAALGQPVGDPINVPDYNAIIGSKLIVSLKPNGSFNNAKDFRSLRRSRSRGTTSKGPVDGNELMGRVKEIFDEDSPTNKSPNPLATDATNPEDLDF